ncbi:hypothetical protein [Nocardia noduli]|uniref:hypothetical protein n=1 Tax=Nocardia noduli TaxID=2815722 RepID=UPI001C23EABD|nr:hypothetical protein [Nocardia noduli]
MNSALVLLTALATTSITGCAAAATTTVDGKICSADSFAAPFAATDPCDGEAVVTAALAAVFDYRPGEQADQRDAARTARPLLTPALAQQAESSAQAWGPVTAAQWQRWRADHTPVHTSVTVSRDDHPPDTVTAFARVAVVEIEAPDTTPITFPVYATLSRTAPTTGWFLSGLRVQA